MNIPSYAYDICIHGSWTSINIYKPLTNWDTLPRYSVLFQEHPKSSRQISRSRPWSTCRAGSCHPPWRYQRWHPNGLGGAPSHSRRGSPAFPPGHPCERPEKASCPLCSWRHTATRSYSPPWRSNDDDKRLINHQLSNQNRSKWPELEDPWRMPVSLHFFPTPSHGEPKLSPNISQVCRSEDPHIDLDTALQ